MTPTEALASLNLTVKAVFVPFSLSRNNGKTKGRDLWQSLNWTVTLLRGDREILTTDYSAGIAHCPGHNKPVPKGWDRPARFWTQAITEWEIENGHQAQWTSWGGSASGTFKAARQPASQEQRDAGLRDMVRIPILPKPEDVVAALLMDIVEEPFEDWASNLGYDPDSIKAKAIYDLCVQHTMQLRQWLGNDGIETLREAFQDY